MLAKSGYIVDARQVFDKILTIDFVSWSAMIAEYAKSGHGEEYLSLYHQLNLAGLMPVTT